MYINVYRQETNEILTIKQTSEREKHNLAKGKHEN